MCSMYAGITNFCDNSSCEHLCCLSATDRRGYSCMCNDGFRLDNDGSSCISEFLHQNVVLYTDLIANSRSATQ